LVENRGGEAVVIRLGDYQGRALVDLRTWFTDRDGVHKPATKGLALGVKQLPQLFKAVGEALTQARVRGLIGDDR
jgi:hypothetical protein